MHNKLIVVALAVALLSIACQSDNPAGMAASGIKSGDWEIPVDQIYDGGPGKDGIPALTNPEIVEASSAGFLGENELVVGIKVDNETRAYPHQILDWHEIINDDIGDEHIAVTYCPLTGTGIGWDRVLDGKITTFGVSGLLYNTNLIPYDRATDSNWSQMKLKAVNGILSGTRIKTHQVIETKWATWKRIAPTSGVVSRSTGFSRNYGQYPYGDYRTNHNTLIFPVSSNDGRLSRKERVHGILVGGLTKAYRIASFGNVVRVLNEEIAGSEIVVVGNSTDNYVVSYKRRVDGDLLTFKSVQDQLPIIMSDNEGSSWDIFGKAVSGPRAGKQLVPLESYNAYWFAWAAFWPRTELFK